MASKTMKYDRDLPSIRIININARDIYSAIDKKEKLKIKNSKELFDYHFSDIVPPNLDLIHLYRKGKLRLKESQNELYSFDFVNVSFKLPYWKDEYDENNKVAPTLTPDKIREKLYVDGFEINDKKYVRYKRSAGSAKGGSCLFIREDLFNSMDKWSKAGLDDGKNSVCMYNITSYEAYRALSISGLIATLDLKPHNILFVKDYKHKLKKQRAVKAYVERNIDRKFEYKTEDSTLNVENNIFDGEGLLDVSVFKQANMPKKSMMLLRNRFFKCCAFNTNLQKWFEENKITSVEQLNGFTFAKDVKEIVLVVPESCLKYIKFTPGGFTKENCKKWCDAVSNEDGSSIFGIVKTDKDTRFFNGDMVETTYQFLNTLQLGQSEVKQLLRLNLDYIEKVKNIKDTPEYLRHYLEAALKSDDADLFDDSEGEYFSEAAQFSDYSYKYKVCLELMKIDKRAIQTKLFKQYVYEDIINSMALKFYNGRVLVHGLYATMFGNPYEFLKYIILDEKHKPLFSKENYESSLGCNNIYSPFFGDQTRIVGSRAPHITMGNVLTVINKRVPEIDKWFNLSKNIVAVDAINNNIQHQLNGCDYDSDTVLLTDNDVLVESVLKNKHIFNIPYGKFNDSTIMLKEIEKNDRRKNLLLNLAKIDNKIAINNVGKIINLSQLLNSHLWDRLNKNKDFNYIDLYEKIAGLAILSGVEIDSAKKNFGFSTSDALHSIQKYATDNNYSGKEPVFYKYITNKPRPRIGEIEDLINSNKLFKTAMDYIWDETHSQELKKHRLEDVSLFDLVAEGFATKGLSKHSYDAAKQAIDILIELRDLLRKFKYYKYNIDSFELEKNDFNNAVNTAFRKIKLKLNSIKKAQTLIKTIEKGEYEPIKNKVINKNSLLYFVLYIICTHEIELGYSLSDLFSKDAVGVPAIRLARKNEVPHFTLFNKYEYVVDDVDVLVEKIFR